VECCKGNNLGRPDPFLNMLADIGFLPVRLPRPDLAPLLLLEVSGKDLNPLGDVGTVMTPGDVPLPPLKPDATTAGSIQGSRTSRISFNIGTDLLTQLISAMAGTSLNIKAGYAKAATLRFEFSDVLVNRIDITQLDGFLSRAAIRPEMQHVNRLLKDGKVSVVTATLKSGKFLVAAQDEDGVDIPVEVPVIQNAVLGNITVQTEGASDLKVAYEGTKPVVFAIQAVRLFFDDAGRYTMFKPLKAGSGAVRKPGIAPRSDDIETVTVEGIFANVAGESQHVQ
jgi:hypothetical protein